MYIEEEFDDIQDANIYEDLDDVLFDMNIRVSSAGNGQKGRKNSDPFSVWGKEEEKLKKRLEKNQMN